MFDKYSFKKPENTDNLAKQMPKSTGINSKFNQHLNKKNIRKSSTFNKNQQQIISESASGPCSGSRGAKMAEKAVWNRVLGVPWDHLGNSKLIKMRKKTVLKINQNSELFQRASQSRLKRIWNGQKPKKSSKTCFKSTLGSEKTELGESAYFSGPADARRGSSL